MFLSDVAEFGIVKSVVNNPVKTILGGSGLIAAGAVGASYRNKKDKRTLRQRITDVGTHIAPLAVMSAAIHSKNYDKLMKNIREKHGKKGLALATVGALGAGVTGNIAAQQYRNKHAEGTRKNRKEGQRLKNIKVDALGLKYNDTSPLKVY